jgi:membrane-associated phospholipid phosphatase
VRGALAVRAREQEMVLVRGSGASLLERRALRFPRLIWFLSLLVCSLLVTVAFVYLDVPIAQRVLGIFSSAESVGRGFASSILLGMEAAVALTLIVMRIARGPLPPVLEATALACLTSICGYATNDSTLKLLFGVRTPLSVLHGSPHVFRFLDGSAKSSFPSGHMVIASSFAGVFMRLYPKSIPVLSALLSLAAVLLVVGEWHFLSDVIAGTFVGISAGLLAGELWLAHSR